MSTRTVVGFVGKPFGAFITWLQEHGYAVHLFHDIQESYTQGTHIDEFHAIDFSTKESAWKSLEKLNISSPACMVSIYENAVLPKSWICEFYGLPGLSEASARTATDKFLMRSAFEKYCPQFTPKFSLVSSWDDVERFLANESVRFPLVLKPTNLFKSLLVTKNVTKEELRQNFDEGINLIQGIYKKEKVSLEARFVLEEYLDGPSYSIEVFCDKDGKAVAVPSAVDLLMGRDIGVNDNYNYSRKLPSALSNEQQKLVQEAAVAGVQAMDLRSSPAHVEIVYTADGPKLIEIGARTGGYRPRLYALAEGLDLFHANVEVAVGVLPTFIQTKNANCSVYELFAEREGVFKAIAHLDAVRRFSSLYYLSEKVLRGEKTGPAKKGYRTAAVVILTSTDKEVFEKETEFFEKKVRVVLE